MRACLASPSAWTASCRRCSDAAAPALRRRAGARRTSRPSTPRGRYIRRARRRRRSRAMYWVNTYALREPAALRARGADPARGGAGPPPADRAAAGAAAAVPPFRRYGYISAFGEGWGLYSEWLGLEMGFYTRPVQRLRPAHLRDVARLPPGGGHRHARQGLDAPAGDRLHGREHGRCRCTRSRPRSTATSPGRARRWPTRSAS